MVVLLPIIKIHSSKYFLKIEIFGLYQAWCTIDSSWSNAYNCNLQQNFITLKVVHFRKDVKKSLGNWIPSCPFLVVTYQHAGMLTGSCPFQRYFFSNLHNRCCFCLVWNNTAARSFNTNEQRNLQKRFFNNKLFNIHKFILLNVPSDSAGFVQCCNYAAAFMIFAFCRGYIGVLF